MISMRWSPDVYREALEFAARAHGEQKVPGKPYTYMVHLASVCIEAIVALDSDPRADANLTITCALLHDVLEDTKTSAAAVESQFGRQVLKGVKALTKNSKLPKDQQMLDSLDRIKREKMEIGIVKMADRTVNLSMPPQGWSKAKARAYWEEAKTILKELKECNAFLAKRLNAMIKRYRAYL
jgi:(p)ppGpp synthase/HD superfamily hydrolase